MSSPAAVPTNSLLGAYQKQGAFTDCYTISVPDSVTLAQFIEAFYTTRLFKIERSLLATFLKYRSSDKQAMQLAHAHIDSFSAWQVETRKNDQILLRAWQTRSWLSVEASNDEKTSTRLYFGSAVLAAHSTGKINPLFHLIGGFHQLYSKLLLRAAANKLIKNVK